jgi:hypothetical protein
MDWLTLDVGFRSYGSLGSRNMQVNLFI